MGLNEAKGNMYPFCTHTWNVLKGKCQHNCSYCYMEQHRLKSLRFDNKEMKTDLGKGNFIFVGSSTDMFADNVPEHWINSVLSRTALYTKNKYLFQSKNPKRFKEFSHWFYENRTILGTTIETNQEDLIIKHTGAPLVVDRVEAMMKLPFEKMVTLEPLMDFDVVSLVALIKMTHPKWVNIGADSKGHGLPEPPASKIRALISELQKFTDVKQKNNLSRLMR